MEKTLTDYALQALVYILCTVAGIVLDLIFRPRFIVIYQRIQEWKKKRKEIKNIPEIQEKGVSIQKSDPYHDKYLKWLHSKFQENNIQYTLGIQYDIMVLIGDIVPIALFSLITLTLLYYQHYILGFLVFGWTLAHIGSASQHASMIYEKIAIGRSYDEKVLENRPNEIADRRSK